VPGLTGVAQVTTGHWHGCAARSNGTAWCWGSRYDGVIGDGGSTDGELSAWPPVRVANLTGVVDVSAGLQSTCARTSAGAVWCWGRNAVGQVGDPDTFIARVPVQVQGLPGPVTQVQVGSQHACARRADGSVWCWGWNHDGQLGDGTTTNREVATRSLMTKAVSVSPGRDHTCARTSANRVRCWGENEYGQLGNGTTVERWTPVAVVRLTGVKAVTTGDGFTCTLLTDATLRCWGHNDHGQLGNGTTVNSAFPTPVLG
jgi:alpha-tubulin suppressor-like RCC1 family protein